MLLSEAVAGYIDGRAGRGEITAVTASHFRSRLGSLVAACPPDMADMDRATIERWQASIGHQRPASRRAYLSTVKTFCRWAIVEGHLATDPTVAVARIREPRRPPRCLPAAALARLALVLPDLRAEVVVSLMFVCGLRCCEVARLAMGDIDPAAGHIVVVGKNGDGRLLPLPPAAAVIVARWVAVRGARPGLLVGLSAGSLSVMVSAWMNAAGIKAQAYDGVSAHALRHTFAANMLQRCGNVRTVQAALGHESLATTQRYLPWATLEELRAAMTA